MKTHCIFIVFFLLLSFPLQAQLSEGLDFDSRKVLQTSTQAILIKKKIHAVMKYISNAEHLPQWAPQLCDSVKKHGDFFKLKKNTTEFVLSINEDNEAGIIDMIIFQEEGNAHIFPFKFIATNETETLLIFTILKIKGLEEELWNIEKKVQYNELVRLKQIIEKL